MKSKVELSAFSTVITLAVIVLMIVGIVVSWDDGYKSPILFAILMGLVIVSLVYYPQSIEATGSSLIIHRQFKDKIIPYGDISSVERCYPSLGGLRLCGSGGFFGYWGYYTDIVIGNYFGYYGKRSQCILVRLNNGRQYVISCKNPDEMICAISSQLK